MEIKTKELAHKLKLIKKVIPERGVTGFPQGVYIENDSIHVNNSWMGLTAKLINDTGENFFLPQRAIETILGLTHDGISIKSDDTQKISIKAKGLKSSYQSIPPESVTVRKRASSCAEVQVESEDFLQALNFTHKAVPKYNTNPAHLGVLMEVRDGQLNLVAVDSHRMQVATIPYTIPIEGKGELRTIIPREACKQLLSIGLKGELLVQSDSTSANFYTEEYSVTVTSCVGSFFSYWSALNDFSDSVIIEKMPLIQAVTRARNCVDKDVKAPLRVVIANNTMEISIASTLGEYKEELPVTMDEGYTITIGFDSSYLLDMLGTRSEKELAFLFKSEVDPVIVDGEHFKSMVLPVRIKPIPKEEEGE